MSSKKRIVIIGASSAIAEHCAQIWIKKQLIDLTLIGRNEKRVQRVAQDLKIRSPETEIDFFQADFLNPVIISDTVEKIYKTGNVDIVLIAQGSLPNQKNCQDNISYCRDELYLNGISPVLFAEAFAKHMEKANNGTIILLGSVAGDRGRQSNYIYGAAKGLITRYAEGLQHRFASTKVNVVLIKPGPTETPMTAHLKAAGAKLASVDKVALQIVEAVYIGKKVVYTPAKWSFIMMIIRHLPSFIFNKIRI